MNIREQILEVLNDINDDIDYESAKDIIDKKLLDSFQIVTLVSELCEAFDVDISPKWLVPKHFNTVDAMEEMISAVLDE